MIPGIVARARRGGSGGAPVTVSEPWETFASTDVVVGGELVLGGFDLSGLLAVRIELSGIVVTSDDSRLFLRLHIAGSPVATGYMYTQRPIFVGTTQQGAHHGTADDWIALVGDDAGEMQGNAATESFGGTITVYMPGSGLTKMVQFLTSGMRPNGGPVIWTGAGKLNTGVITGFTLLGSSNIVSGKMILTGLA